MAARSPGWKRMSRNMGNSNQSFMPHLRFPEFREAGEWDEKPISDIAPLQRGFDLPNHQLQPGIVPVVYSNGVQNYHNVGMARGPGLVTGRSGTIGNLHFIEKGEYWPHNTTLWVTSFERNIPKFIYFLYAGIRIERFVSGSGVPTLNRNYVHAFNACIPQIKEQQKIADCLSSLDALITDQEEKLEALKAHKKGLMQQLFPREGETVPRLRFSGFQKMGQWKENQLGGVLEAERSDLALSKLEFVKEGFPVYGVDGLSGHISTFDQDEDYIAIVKDGSVGKLFLCRGKSSVLGTLAYLKPKASKSNHLHYLYYFLQTINLMKYVTGSVIPHIYYSDYRRESILTPPLKEQQKIANCLLTLEALITTQANKIDGLNLHKRGLMQQIFPNPEVFSA